MWGGGGGGEGGRERPNRKRSDFPVNIASHFCVHIDRFRGMCRSICVLFQLFHNYDEYNPREQLPDCSFPPFCCLSHYFATSRVCL